MKLGKGKMIIDERKSVKQQIVKDLMQKERTKKTSQKVFDFNYNGNFNSYNISNKNVFITVIIKMKIKISITIKEIHLEYFFF